MKVWLRGEPVPDLEGEPGAGAPQQRAGGLQQAGPRPAAGRLAPVWRDDAGGPDRLPSLCLQRLLPDCGAHVWRGPTARRNMVSIHSFSSVLMTKNWQKFTAEQKKLSKTTIYLSLGLYKARPSYRKKPSALKRDIQHFKTWNFLILWASRIRIH